MSDLVGIYFSERFLNNLKSAVFMVTLNIGLYRVGKVFYVLACNQEVNSVSFSMEARILDKWGTGVYKAEMPISGDTSKFREVEHVGEIQHENFMECLTNYVRWMAYDRNVKFVNNSRSRFGTTLATLVVTGNRDFILASVEELRREIYV